MRSRGVDRSSPGVGRPAQDSISPTPDARIRNGSQFSALHAKLRGRHEPDPPRFWTISLGEERERKKAIADNASHTWRKRTLRFKFERYPQKLLPRERPLER